MTLTHAFIKVVWFFVVGLGPVEAAGLVGIFGLCLTCDSEKGSQHPLGRKIVGMLILFALLVGLCTISIWLEDKHVFWGDYDGMMAWWSSHQIAEKP